MKDFYLDDSKDFIIISRSTVSIHEQAKGQIEDVGFRVVSSFPELFEGNVGPFDITALQVLCAFARNEVPAVLRCRLVANKEQVNVSDYLGRTPLLYAVLNGNVKLVDFLLECGASTECKLNYGGGKIGGENLKPNGDLPKYKRLLQKLPLFDCTTFTPSGRTPLHIAVKKGHVGIVKLLILKGANVNSIDDKGVTPLLLAGCNVLQTYEEITKILVLNGADVTKKDSTGTSALYHSVHLEGFDTTKLLIENGAWLSTNSYGENELHVAALKGFTSILQFFLEHPRIKVDDVNQRDFYGRTAAYKAAYADRKDCLRLLLNKGADLSLTTKDGETVSDKVFKNVSAPMKFLKDVLNGYIQNDVDHGVKLNFEMLAPAGCEQMNVLHTIFDAVDEREKLEILQHPLVEAYLNLKWAKAKPFFYILICSYVVFVLSLSTYVLMLVQKVPYVRWVSITARYILTISATGLLIHAIIQGVVMWKKLWQKFEVWMNITSTVIALVVVTFAETNHLIQVDKFVQCQEWVLHSTSVAILLAWTELMLLMGRFPTLGYYALMFGAVLLNVIKVLSTFFCLVIGFALCFSIQFYKDHTFQDLWLAMVKTTVMMLGEFEYVDLFSTMDTGGLQVTARLIFFLFIIVVSIVLMNLMVGLAVSDIQGLQQEGSARRLEKQAEFVQQLEEVVGRIVKWRCLPKWLTKFLVQRKSIPLRFTIKAEWYTYHKRRNFEIKKLTPKLLESIEGIARRNKRQRRELSKKQMIEIIENIKLLMDS